MIGDQTQSIGAQQGSGSSSSWWNPTSWNWGNPTLSSVLQGVGDLGGHVLGAVGGLANYFGAREQNKANLQLAREQMQFQERMANTEVSRRMDDLKNAGINPLLAGSYGGGASSPQGTAPFMQNTMAGVVSNAQQAMRMREELKSIRASRSQTESQTFLNKELARLTASNAKSVDLDSAKKEFVSRWYQQGSKFQKNLLSGLEKEEGKNTVLGRFVKGLYAGHYGDY